MTLLPIAAQVQQSPSESPSCGDVIFEPDRESVLSTLLDMYIGKPSMQCCWRRAAASIPHG